MIKSENEIQLIRTAHSICESVLAEMSETIRPGVTEREMKGQLLEAMYRNGAECEAYAPYLLSGSHTREAISGASEKAITTNELVQLSYGVRYGGYASSFARLVFFGRMPAEMKRTINFGLEAHKKTYEYIREGVQAASVVRPIFYTFKNDVLSP